MAETVRQLVRDLREEQLVLDHLVAALDPADWLRPTPAQGWDVRDSIGVWIFWGESKALFLHLTNRCREN